MENQQNPCHKFKIYRQICEGFGPCAVMTDRQERAQCTAEEACTAQEGPPQAECISQWRATKGASSGAGPGGGGAEGRGGGRSGLSLEQLGQGMCEAGYVQIEQLCIQRNAIKIRGAAPQAVGQI